MLPQKQREAIVLRDFYGLRYSEVATALGTSRPAVEALLFRGRRRLQRRLRPGMVAGFLVVPLAVQESIAYAVPGFASTAATPAAAAAVGVPLIAKLAATGAAVGIAGSAGVVAQRSLHDPPARPTGGTAEQVVPVAANKTPQQAQLLPVPAGGFPIVRQQGGGEDGDHGAAGRAASDTDDRDEADDEDRGENRGPGKEDEDRAEEDRHDNSGPGGGHDADAPESQIDKSDDVGDREPDDAALDNSGPGSGGEEDGDGDGEENELDD